MPPAVRQCGTLLQMTLRTRCIIRRLATAVVIGGVCTVAAAWILVMIGPTLKHLGPSYVRDDGRHLWEVRYSSTIGFRGSIWHARAAWLIGATSEQRQRLVDYFTHTTPGEMRFPTLDPWPPSLKEPYLDVVRASHSFAIPHAPDFKTVPDEFRSFAVPTTGAYFSVRKWGAPFLSMWCASDMQHGRWVRDAGSIGVSGIQRPMFSSAGDAREVRFPYYIDWPPFIANVAVYGVLWAVATSSVRFALQWRARSKRRPYCPGE